MSDPGKAVFLSYASQDSEAAKRICEALRAAGVEVWFDQSELVGGDQWDGKIRGQISSCALFMPVISANTQARREGYFRIEWRLAAQRTHAMADNTPFLVPIVIDDTKDTAALVPAEFKAVQWTKLAGGEAPPAFAQRVKKMLDGSDVGRDLRIPPSSEKAGFGDPALQRPGVSKWWWVLPIFGVMMALMLVLKEGRKDPAPFVASPAAAPASGSSEVVQLWARLLPEKWQAGDFEAMSPTLERLTQANPADADAWALLSIINSLQVTRNLQSGTGPLEKGKMAAERAQRLAPGSPRSELALGLHLTAMISRGGDVRAGQPHIERALAGLPRDHLTRTAELASLWLGYQIAETQRRARAWLDDEPTASYPAWILAESSLAARQPAEVERWAMQAGVDDDITGVRALVTLFEARYYLQADLPAARTALDRIPSSRRAVPRVVFSRWLAAMAERNWDQALQEVARVPEPILFDRNFHGPKALLAGLAQQAANRTPAALAQFREAERQLREELVHDSENEELHAVLALTLACQGKATEAQAELAAVEPLLVGRDPSHYAAHETSLVAQTYGLLGDMGKLTQALRWLFTHPSTVPLTPAIVRIDPRFSRYVAEPTVAALLTEFSSLDQAGTKLATSSLLSASSARPEVELKSVAVLAFANLSDDKGNEYFSDGISEELLNVLAKIPGLKVTARTSSFHFKGTNTAIPEIAQQLGVVYVVEGSVRKQGDKVRITAQLIKAADGFHVWSDTFTRDLKDIFAVQDEIAGLIAKNLELKIGTSSPAATVAVNPQAFELYVQARQAWNLRNAAGFAQAEELLTRALMLEPKFARAHAALADVWALRAVANGVIETFGQRNAPVFTQIAGEIEKALALDPDSSEARASFGLIVRFRQWDLAASERELRRSIELNPNYATAHHWLGNCLSESGRIDEGLAELRRAAELDPFSLRILENYAKGLVLAGRQEEALAVLGRAEALSARAPLTLFTKAEALLQLGRRAEAIAVARELGDAERAVQLAKAGEKSEAEAALGEAEGWLRYQLLIALGRTAEAIASLRAEDMPASKLRNWLMDPRLDPFRQEPHFLNLLATLGLTEAHARMQAWRAAHSATGK